MYVYVNVYENNHTNIRPNEIVEIVRYALHAIGYQL